MFGPKLKIAVIAFWDSTVRRIMKGERLSGARRGRQFKITTISNEHQRRIDYGWQT
jgi:hypothetical protein